MSESVERREPIQDVETVNGTVANPGPSFDASDLALSRLRVVGKDARLVELGVAKPGDLAIGTDAEDVDSAIYPAPGGLRLYVITWRTNYACGYGGPQGQWDAGDPERPPAAKKQYHYTLFIPEHDQLMPVIYTANGTAAKIMRSVNTAIARNGQDRPYELAFEITTEIRTGTPSGQTSPKSWPSPVLKLAEANPSEVEAAKRFYDKIVGPGQAALNAGSTPTF